tara:strand:+ start:58 stop:606 length:549 start_codon:yes stop_codon:yes gene_type:complete
MTEEKIKQIIKLNKLPPDELDNLFNNLIGNILPILLTSIFGYFVFFKEQTAKSASTGSLVQLLLLSLVWLIYNIWKKKREKRLNKIQTDLSLEENITLINKLIKTRNLDVAIHKLNYYEIHISSWMNNGCKLVLVATANNILLNIRIKSNNRYGRTQNTLGFIPFHKWRISRWIKQLLTTQN